MFEQRSLTLTSENLTFRELRSNGVLGSSHLAREGGMMLAAEMGSPCALLADQKGATENGQPRSPQAQRDTPQSPEGRGHGSFPPTRGGRARRRYDLRARGCGL